MVTSRLLAAVCLCLPCLATNAASASEFYSYTGNNYEMIFGPVGEPYDTSMRVTATIELASALAPNLVDADVIPISFRLDDGPHTITNDSDIEEQTLRFSTDALGNITFWNVRVRTAFPSNVGDQQWRITTLNTTPGTQADVGSTSTLVILGALQLDSGQNSGNPGTWTVVSAPVTTLAASNLPTSRSVQPTDPATVFATIINAGTADATGCDIAPLTGLAGEFFYQTTDPTTNALTGMPDTPVDIAAGALQTFLFAFTPTVEIAPTEVRLNYDCTNTKSAPLIVGVNTLLVSASFTPVPDIIALAATPTGDGIVNLPGSFGANAFAVSAVNVGASDTITASADTASATLPLILFMCETDPQTGNCVSAPATDVTTTVNGGATPTFAVFVNGDGVVPFDPANNRIFVRFRDTGDVTRGSTSVAVRTL